MQDTIHITKHTHDGSIVGYTVAGTSEGNAFGMYTSKADTAKAEVEYWKAEAVQAGRDVSITMATKTLSL